MGSVMTAERIAALREIHQRANDFENALQQITKASGAYNRDPITHAHNCLRDMQATAINVLRKYGIPPQREDDPIDGEVVPVREFTRSDV